MRADDFQDGAEFATFADMILCFCIVLIIIISFLALNVNEEVKVDSKDPQSLVRDLKQENEILKNKVERMVVALNGEQRFTGAREQAKLVLAYDYFDKIFYFLPSREYYEAFARRSDESNLEFGLRKLSTLRKISNDARSKRGFSADEISALVSSFSTYNDVVPVGEKDYRIQQREIEIHYSPITCQFISRDSEIDELETLSVKLAINLIDQTGQKGHELYPETIIEVENERRRVLCNGVDLSPDDLRQMLLSISGRGALLELKNIGLRPPVWLREQVLTPSGYIGGTPGKR